MRIVCGLRVVLRCGSVVAEEISETPSRQNEDNASEDPLQCGGIDSWNDCVLSTASQTFRLVFV